MPVVAQLNLHLENQIGTLARLSRDLANGGVNLLALSAMEGAHAKDAVVRLLVPNRELAEHVLSKAHYGFTVEEVLFLELKNRPGALARAVEKLAAAHIDVTYAYATAHTQAQKTAVVIAVAKADLERAAKLLG